jgi:hypothetical protein
MTATGRIGLVLVMAFGLAVNAQAAGAIKLANASFEDPEQEVDNPYGDLAARWGRWGCWINRESEWRPTKQGSCLVGYHHWQVEDANTSGIYQDIAGTAAGSEIRFSIYASKDKDTNVESIELRLEPYNGGDSIASKVYSIEEIKKGGWAKLEVAGKGTGEGIRVLVVVKPAADGERVGCIKFDEADLDVSTIGGKQSTLARAK